MNIFITSNETKATKDGVDESYFHVTNLQDSFGEGSHTLHIYIVFHGSEKKPNKHFSLKIRNGRIIEQIYKEKNMVHARARHINVLITRRTGFCKIRNI